MRTRTLRTAGNHWRTGSLTSCAMWCARTTVIRGSAFPFIHDPTACKCPAGCHLLPIVWGRNSSTSPIAATTSGSESQVVLCGTWAKGVSSEGCFTKGVPRTNLSWTRFSARISAGKMSLGLSPGWKAALDEVTNRRNLLVEGWKYLFKARQSREAARLALVRETICHLVYLTIEPDQDHCGAKSRSHNHRSLCKRARSWFSRLGGLVAHGFARPRLGSYPH
jgi:hypothetical protein